MATAMTALVGKLVALWALIAAWRHRNDPPRSFWGPGCMVEYDAAFVELRDLDAQIRRARRLFADRFGYGDIFG